MAIFNRGGNWINQLPAQVKTDVLKRMVALQLLDGETLYQRSANASGLYQVVSGFVELKATGPSGNEMLVTIYGPGNLIGELPLMGDGERAFDAVALGEVNVMALQKQDFDELIEQYPEIYHRLVEKLYRVIVVLLNRIEENALFSLQQRLAQLIVSAAQTYGVEHIEESGAEQYVIEMPLSQQNMGKLLGVTRHSVLREIKKWKALGIVDKVNARWVVLRMTELQLIAENG